METLKSVLAFRFLPLGQNLALLVLRLWFGLMLLTHGWSKVAGFSDMKDTFPDPLGVGSATSLALAVLAEVAGSLLLITGTFTRLAALACAATMAVAFLGVHGGALTGTQSGELAYTYLGAFAVLFIAGGGRFAIDAKIHGEGA